MPKILISKAFSFLYFIVLSLTNGTTYQEAAMILIICLVLFTWALDGLCADYDHEAERRNDYRRSERRHKEMMEVMKNRKKVTRTVARDEHGRFVAQN